MTVVGVVGDIKQGARDEATVPQMYEPLAQAVADLGPYGAMIGVAGDMSIVIRTTADPLAVESALNKTVHELDPLLAVADVNTMDEIVAATESSRRFDAIILTTSLELRSSFRCSAFMGSWHILFRNGRVRLRSECHSVQREEPSCCEHFDTHFR